MQIQQSDLESRIQNMLDQQLLDHVAEGLEAFQPGVYDMYLAEAKRRGFAIDSSRLAALRQKTEKKNVQNKSRNLVMEGYLLVIILAGMFAFIPALILLTTKAENGQKYYDRKYRTHGYIFGGISVTVWVLGAIILIRRLMFDYALLLMMILHYVMVFGVVIGGPVLLVILLVRKNRIEGERQ